MSHGDYEFTDKVNQVDRRPTQICDCCLRTKIFCRQRRIYGARKVRVGVLPIRPASSAYFFSLPPRVGGAAEKRVSSTARSPDGRSYRKVHQKAHSIRLTTSQPQEKNPTQKSTFLSYYNRCSPSVRCIPQSPERSFFPLFPARLRNPANYVIAPFPSSFLPRKEKKICIASNLSARRGGYFFLSAAKPTDQGEEGVVLVVVVVVVVGGFGGTVFESPMYTQNGCI